MQSRIKDAARAAWAILRGRPVAYRVTTFFVVPNDMSADEARVRSAGVLTLGRDAVNTFGRADTTILCIGPGEHRMTGVCTSSVRGILIERKSSAQVTLTFEPLAEDLVHKETVEE